MKTFHQRTIRYVIKGLRYLATEIDSEKVKINGFYSDWTMPTFHNAVLALRLYGNIIEGFITTYIRPSNWETVSSERDNRKCGEKKRLS